MVAQGRATSIKHKAVQSGMQRRWFRNVDWYRSPGPGTKNSIFQGQGHYRLKEAAARIAISTESS